MRLGSVAGPVIQATGMSEFEDGLGSGDFVSGYSYHMSVRTRLSDHTKQTKFQSQRPNDVETPVPFIWVQRWSNIGTVSTWMGDRLEWYPPPRKNADCSCWLPVLYHIASRGIDQNSRGIRDKSGCQALDKARHSCTRLSRHSWQCWPRNLLWDRG
jgi:hypothetical protein